MQNQNPFAQFTQNNPFAQFVQNNPFAEQMKSYSEFKSPNFDVNQMFSFSRRNAEAFSAASSVMVESMQNVSRNQAENFRTNVEEMLKTAKEMMGSGSPEINTTRQAELAKSLFEASFKNMREASEAMTKSVFEASDVLNKRAAESLDEISTMSKAA
ncbi:MAG: phasin [Rickettsiales bacterium]|nr:phasin [Rickettsiales bacterium]|tara:strand:+ start:1301 stop:1771 length:471 start_codon:yes stop_codon:yes gene_type:complete